MKDKEFNLSEKIRYCSDDATRKCITGLKQRSNHTGYIKVFFEKDVKEFIKRFKKELKDFGKDFLTYDWVCEVIDANAGDKLI